jgi:RNA polymerase sigma-70 factor (ECF subfamily)
VFLLMSDGAHSVAETRDAGASLFDLGALYKTYYATLCVFVRRRFGAGPPEPEDAVQAAFARFAGLPDPGAIQNPKGFLYRTACNFVLDYRRRDVVSARSAADIVTLNANADPADADSGRVIESREMLAAVLAAIETLDPRRRDVLIMHSIQELSCAEIARRLKLSPSRVIQLYADAIQACAQAVRRTEDLER